MLRKGDLGGFSVDAVAQDGGREVQYLFLVFFSFATIHLYPQTFNKVL